MEANVTIELDEIWGDNRFEQREWGDINYFIGPNGTGKTLFAEALNHCLTPRPVRYLSAERLTGLNPERYSEFYRSEMKEGFDIQKEQRYHDIANQIGLSSDAYVTLRNRLDLKVKIQAILSQFFDRDIELTVEGGYLTPKMRDISSSTSNSYDLQEDESHGLKELISLLTIIHNDEYNVLIIDEPELHLHPQYQSDLDTLFSGNLRQTFAGSGSVNNLVRSEGIGSDLMDAIGDIESELTSIVQQIRTYNGQDDDLLALKDKLDSNNFSKDRYLVYKLLDHRNGELGSEFDSDSIEYIRGRVSRTLDVLEESGYYVLERGELEDYLRDDPSPFTVGKDRKREIFDQTRTQLIDANSTQDVRDAVGDIVPLLEKVTTTQTVDLIEYLQRPVSEWVYDVQWEIRRGSIESETDLQKHNEVGKERYGQLFSVEHFSVQETGENSEFECIIKLLPSLDPSEQTYRFDQDTNSSSVELER